MTNLILFGPPGSGKGTQAIRLAEKYELMHISTGDLFRYEIGHRTPLGIKANQYIIQGQLVPDEITIGMLKNRVESERMSKGIILDGFPRTIPQAEALDEYLAQKDQTISALIALQVEEEEIVNRIVERAATSGRPDDADRSVIRNRIAVYHQETAPVFDYYHETEKAHRIDGMGDIEEVFQRLTDLVDTLL